ncbi:hypothetical protein AVEN_30410-1 [Araneus ventricosus]|uniref:Tc1-like transposase DDE domain-containing protein n=1 Tax=Araneus ventricosus TaxID=182803 RepID=A0A4Y2FNI0_ARAVE|nr:hypothetical protein AVEN_30410-1 [Araneus ventricosus]
MLQLYAVPQFPEGVIFQQDGAPPHYGNIVREFLDTTLPQRWIGRGAVMAWPPRSADITPLDFYLRGYVKHHVYSERINDINHLKQRITDVIHSVTPDVLTRVWEELDYRLDMCRATNGAHMRCHLSILFRCFLVTDQKCTMTLRTHCITMKKTRLSEYKIVHMLRSMWYYQCGRGYDKNRL